MGPLANARRIAAMESFIGDALQKGGKIRTGGKRSGNKGYFFEPTVLTDLAPETRALHEEPFGPLALFMPFNTFEDAIAEANRLPYGLAAYAYTRSATTATALGGFEVRCNELCGIWHGAMTTSGQVVSQTAFQSWAAGVQSQEQTSGILAALPPYALVYDPTVIPQLGKEIVNVDGVTGAAGYYYGPGNPVTP